MLRTQSLRLFAVPVSIRARGCGMNDSEKTNIVFGLAIGYFILAPLLTIVLALFVWAIP